jgi:RNA polymerase sigma factor (sigma-70 family)
MSTQFTRRARSGRPYVMAMVLGTALSALSPATASATLAAEPTYRAVSDMGRYCTTCWRNARLPADAWGDCTQEVFCRLLQRVPTARWDQILGSEGEERREFLRAIDAVKKRTQRARKGSGSLDGLADPHDANDRRIKEDLEAVHTAAEDVLSPRQQQILRLSMEGWSVADMARELRLPVERVSDEKYKAVRKLRVRLGVDREEREEVRVPSRLPA